MEAINEKTATDKTDTRRTIRERCREEWETSGRVFCSVVADEAVNAAYLTWKACAAKWKKGAKASLSFRSIRDERQTFVVQKLSASGVFPLKLGEAHATETIPAEAVGRMATVSWCRGRWFLQAQKHIVTKSIPSAGERVALDPGVRTFMTYFSRQDAGKYGDEFSTKILLPLLHQHDRELSARSKLVALKSDAQWWRDQMRRANKRVWRTANRIHDLTEDLHRRVAYDLVSRYDTIILPTFETKQMTKKGRKLRKRTVREMLNLGFYKFAQTLKWMCEKYGKTLVMCSEEYTSKTRSWDGVIHPKLGSARSISDGVITVDRDINGARGIMLKTLTRQLTP